MTMTDPIADMLARIRNASMAHKADTVIPFSNLKMRLAQILEKEGYISKTEKTDNEKPMIKVKLKYKENKMPHIRSVRRISKPGRRIYADSQNLPVVMDQLGVAIISTSKGLMTNREAKKASLGGEVICEIY